MTKVKSRIMHSNQNNKGDYCCANWEGERGKEKGIRKMERGGGEGKGGREGKEGREGKYKL